MTLGNKATCEYSTGNNKRIYIDHFVVSLSALSPLNQHALRHFDGPGPECPLMQSAAQCWFDRQTERVALICSLG